MSKNVSGDIYLIALYSIYPLSLSVIILCVASLKIVFIDYDQSFRQTLKHRLLHQPSSRLKRGEPTHLWRLPVRSSNDSPRNRTNAHPCDLMLCCVNAISSENQIMFIFVTLQ